MNHDTRMHITDPAKFILKLKETTKVCFDGDNLRAEVCKIDPDDSQNHNKLKKENMIRYFRREGTKWLPFGFCISPFICHLVDDFQEELNRFKIA